MRSHLVHMPRQILLSAALAILPAAAHAQWGYAWANQPTVASYVADSKYSRSSSGQPITIKQLPGVGSYQVRFHGLGGGSAPKGTVQVTATGGGRECKVKGWTESSADVLVDVLCFNATGAAEHSGFMVLLVRSKISSDRQGYALADQPTVATYSPSASSSFNSSGGGIEIKHNNPPGDYEVLFKGLGSGVEVGNFQVTAYGPGSDVCTIRDWVVANPDLTVKVQCSKTLGIPIDAPFTLLVEVGGGVGTLQQAYAWGNQPMAMMYNPPADFANGAIDITRSGTGSYTLKVANLGGNLNLLGNVQVTAQGFKGEFCNPVEFFNSGSSLGVQLKCHTASGAPADIPYLVLIEK